MVGGVDGGGGSSFNAEGGYGWGLCDVERHYGGGLCVM